eukprot:scaffold308727_cov36-Tisochrysis_lutea.AAC.2
MRFAVLTKNLILDAVALRRIPWVQILDAYGIARTRADAHPGLAQRSKNVDDCVHYCLPGVPDVFNGRLSNILLQRANAAGETQVGAAEFNPGCIIRRFNFDHGEAPFVMLSPPGNVAGADMDYASLPKLCNSSVKLQLTPAPMLPVEVTCNERGHRRSIGMCSDLDDSFQA